MSGHLIIVAGASPGAPVLWSLHDEAGGAVLAEGRAASMAQLEPLAARQPRLVSLIVPGMDVVALQAALPARSEAQARAAAPYAVEEQLASRLDGLHIALGPRLGGDARLILAMDKALLAAWRDALAAVRLAVRHIVPDYAVWPAQGSGGARLIAIDGRLVVALADGGGFAVEAGWAHHALAPLLRDAGVARLMIHGAMPDWAGAALPAELERAAAPDTETGAGALAGALARTVAQTGGAPVNLLQGAFGRAPAWQPMLRHVRAAAALALCLMLGLAALSLLDAWRDNRAADQRLAQAEALFRSAFPAVKTVVNPRAQMRAQLKQLGGAQQGTFLHLAAALTTALAEVDAVRLDALRYDAERGGLSASLRYTSFGDAEAVRAAIARQGALLEEGGARQSGGVITGDVTVRMP